MRFFVWKEILGPLYNLGLLSTSTTRQLNSTMSNVSIYFNRIAITAGNTHAKHRSHIEKTIAWWLGDLGKRRPLDNLRLPKWRVGLSPSAKRRMLRSVNWMYNLSPARTVQMRNGKFLYNFRCSFVTLTLPSVQAHSDQYIKKEILSYFLKILSRKYALKNYVWKAELQGNGNVHFHLITDCYLDYQALRRHWNTVLKIHGYIDAYASKMKKHTLTSYAKMRNQSVEDVKDAYVQGVRLKWQNPNSVDIKKVRTTKDLAIYLSKYMIKSEVPKTASKNGGEKHKISISEVVRYKRFGNLWYQSSSLSALKSTIRYDYHDIAKWLGRFKNRAKKIVEKTYDYARVIYFDIKNLHFTDRREITELLTIYATSTGYVQPC